MSPGFSSIGHHKVALRDGLLLISLSLDTLGEGSRDDRSGVQPIKETH